MSEKSQNVEQILLSMWLAFFGIILLSIKFSRLALTSSTLSMVIYIVWTLHYIPYTWCQKAWWEFILKVKLVCESYLNISLRHVNDLQKKWKLLS